MPGGSDPDIDYTAPPSGLQNDFQGATITGMNPKKTAGYYTLRFAGLFNLPIPLRYAFGIGVSQKR
jgi:hypothetical protein